MEFKNLYGMFLATIITVGTSYLAVSHYLQGNKNEKSYEAIVQEKLDEINERLQLLQELQNSDNSENQEEEIIQEKDVIAPTEIVTDASILKEITQENELRDLFAKNSDATVILFHMNGCGWCNKMQPVFDAVAKNPKFAKLKFYSVDGRSAQARTVVQELFNLPINGYPFMLLLDKNKVVDKQSGYLEQNAFENKIATTFVYLNL